MMTRSIKLSALLALSASLFTANAWAFGAGNGGNGIKIGGKAYLLDLFEAGLEDHVYTPPEGCTRQEALVRRIETAISNRSVPAALIAGKLCEIALYDQLLSRAILHAIEAYEWRFLNAPLKDTDDDDSDVSVIPGEHLQLASRGERSIRLDAALWRTLEPTHRAALVLHEAVYALVTPDELKNANGVTYQRQSSRIAREVVGYLFSPEFLRKGPAGLIQKFTSLTANYLPYAALATESGDKTFDLMFPASVVFYVHGRHRTKTARLTMEHPDQQIDLSSIGEICTVLLEKMDPKEPNQSVSTYVRFDATAEYSVTAYGFQETTRDQGRVGSWFKSERRTDLRTTLVVGDSDSMPKSQDECVQIMTQTMQNWFNQWKQ